MVRLMTRIWELLSIRTAGNYISNIKKFIFQKHLGQKFVGIELQFFESLDGLPTQDYPWRALRILTDNTFCLCMDHALKGARRQLNRTVPSFSRLHF